MLTNRIVVMAAATLCSALGIGFLMQPTTAPETSPLSDTALDLADLDLSLEPDDELLLEQITLTSARHSPTFENETFQPALVANCDVSVSTTAKPMALVDVTIDAPCQADSRVTVHHAGLMFSDMLDANGSLTVVVPALSETAVFIVDPAQGAGAVASVHVPDFDTVERIAVQWQGTAGFELHAREFGAAYGDQGHVWQGAPSAGTGMIHQLGDAGLLAARQAEIYSFPKGQAAGQVDLTVETEVTALNCDRDVVAQSIEIRDGEMRTRELVLNMPDCGSTGDFLVLNNLVENLKIARN